MSEILGYVVCLRAAAEPFSKVDLIRTRLSAVMHMNVLLSY
jgi:hypothetical protein